MLEHVERPGLGERAVGKRQPPQVAEQQRHVAARVLGEKRADVDADRLGAEVAIPDERAAAAAAEIDDQIAGPWAAETCRSMSLRIFDPRSGGETRSWRASACKRFVEVFRLLGVNASAGRRSRILAAAAPGTCGRSPGSVTLVRASTRRASVPRHPGSGRAQSVDRKSSGRREHVGEERSRAVRRAGPNCTPRRRVRAALAEPARSAASSASVRMPAASASASPGVDEQRVDVVGQNLADAPAGSRPRWPCRRPCTRTA